MTTFSTRVTFDHVRNTAAGFTAANPVLGYGVTGLETDTGRIKVGDGVAAWTALPYLSGAAHQHPIGDVTGLQAALDSKATPAQVTAAVAAVVDAAPGTLDTLNELAAALGDDANFASTVTNALAAKAPLASPTFTGTVGGITKAMVGLGSVDNTADVAKPVSTATQTALDGKVGTTDARLTDAREWSAATVTQAEAEAGTSTSRLAFSPLRVFQAVAAWWAASSAKAKLDGIASGATANATDAQLRDRATHTGTQAHTTITGLGGAATLNVGTTAGTVAAGNDSRLTDQRTPADGSVTDAKIASGGLSTSSLNWAAIQPWAANTAYAKGDLVSFAGIAYRRSAAGTSGATFNTANWQQITPSTFDGSQIASGTVAAARLGSGTANSTTFLRGDQTYASPPVTSVDGATGEVTLTKCEIFDFTMSSKPAAASGSGGSYTFAIPTCRLVRIIAIGGGSGGGSGRRGAASTLRGGGGGGGGAHVRVGDFLRSEAYSTSLAITIGAGGAGGAGVTSDNTDGNAGTRGGDTRVLWSGTPQAGSPYSGIALMPFFAVLNKTAGSGGTSSAGGAAGGTSGFEGTIFAVATPSAGGNGTGTVAESGTFLSPGSGAGGGGISAADATQAGGRTIIPNSYNDGNNAAVGGAAGGGSGTNRGTNISAFGALSGCGGSGGGSSINSAGGSGGNGAWPGGGGGGGGASLNGFASGAGGNGAEGFVRVICWS